MTDQRTFTTPAIVLKNFRKTDSTAQIHALTPGMGIIDFTKFGYVSKRTDSASVLQPINLIDLKLEKQGHRIKLTDAVTKTSYPRLKSDYNKIQTVLSIFRTLLLSRVFDEKDYGLVYVLVTKMLETLEKNDPCLYTAALYFYYQLAWCLGISFSFRETGKGDNFYIQVENGLFFQKKMPLENGKAYNISNGLYGCLRNFQDVKFAQIRNLSYITLREYNEFREMYKRYTGYHLDQPVILGGIEISEV